MMDKGKQPAVADEEETSSEEEGSGDEYVVGTCMIDSVSYLDYSDDGSVTEYIEHARFDREHPGKWEYWTKVSLVVHSEPRRATCSSSPNYL